MLSWECIEIQGVTKCQIPYNEQWLTWITYILWLITLIIFSWVCFFKLLSSALK